MARFGHGEDRYTTTVEDAARWEAMRGADEAGDDRPTAAEVEDFGIGGYVATGALVEAYERLKVELWGEITPQDEPPF